VREKERQRERQRETEKCTKIISNTNAINLTFEIIISLQISWVFFQGYDVYPPKSSIIRILI
jgi:hypothetical protein